MLFVHTAGARHRSTVPPLDESVVSEKLSSQIVVLHSPEVLSSTAVKLSWDVRRNRHFIEGFRIKYRVASGPSVRLSVTRVSRSYELFTHMLHKALLPSVL